MLLLKHFITKVLEYKVGLKGRIKFECVAICSLVMSLCSHDLRVTSLNNNYHDTLNSSRLTVVQLTQRLVFGWNYINLLDGKISACLLYNVHLATIGLK